MTHSISRLKTCRVVAAVAAGCNWKLSNTYGGLRGKKTSNWKNSFLFQVGHSICFAEVMLERTITHSVTYTWTLILYIYKQNLSGDAYWQVTLDWSWSSACSWYTHDTNTSEPAAGETLKLSNVESLHSSFFEEYLSLKYGLGTRQVFYVLVSSVVLTLFKPITRMHVCVLGEKLALQLSSSRLAEIHQRNSPRARKIWEFHFLTAVSIRDQSGYEKAAMRSSQSIYR